MVKQNERKSSSKQHDKLKIDDLKRRYFNDFKQIISFRLCLPIVIDKLTKTLKFVEEELMSTYKIK